MKSNARRMEVIYLLVVAYATVMGILYVGARVVVYADCPACFKDETPPTAPNDAQGHPRRPVYVDLTAGDGRYRTALNMAMGTWNGTAAPVGFTLAQPQVPDANGNYPPMPQVMLQVGALGTNSKGEKICARTTTSKTGTPPTNITVYTITLPPESSNWSLARIAEVLEHEMGHILGLDDVSQGCDSIMQQGNADCTTSVHSTIETRDVEAAQKYETDRIHCDKKRGKNSHETGGGDPCGSDPCCQNPCCGDPCCGDPCCGDDQCCGDYCCAHPGDPSCQTCYTVCERVCGDNEDCWDWDEYTHTCYLWGSDVCWDECHQECY
jgi:hypothetical protein